MSEAVYRTGTKDDIPFLAKIRSENSGTKEYWNDRIQGYFNGTINPQQSLPPRIFYVASFKDETAGFIAGHLSRRYGCEGELEWIDVVERYRRKGLGSTLLRCLARWFVDQHAYKICIDPGNESARNFYKHQGAVWLNEHWMYWNDISRILENDAQPGDWIATLGKPVMLDE